MVLYYIYTTDLKQLKEVEKSENLIFFLSYKNEINNTK
jgi:hypothetical protein